MELTFEYDVETKQSNVIICSVTFKEELDQEQVDRLASSWATGKYHYLDEDGSIRDIYDMIYDIAMELETQQEHGELLESVVQVQNFRYPAEVRG